jgi:hypothetical protein
MKDTDISRIAQRRANAKIGFFIHAAVFILVNIGLYFINMHTSPNYQWSVWPLGGWGLGLAIHGVVTFLSGSGIRERMVEAEMKRLQKK